MLYLEVAPTGVAAYRPGCLKEQGGETDVAFLGRRSGLAYLSLPFCISVASS